MTQDCLKKESICSIEEVAIATVGDHGRRAELPLLDATVVIKN